ncbi:MAG: hypothetical protein H6Q20_1893 [Bacteroidetes bacterium]|jgi:hypothetical protein|nr:hypothetical protein [Bacteroidota bacterium]
MKKLFFVTAAILLSVLMANADPAKKVNLTYQNGKLKIEAIHRVKDVKTHYIDKIVVKVDGKDVKTLALKSQSSNDAETLELVIPEIKKGSKIEVTTRCNEFGSKTGKLTVE